MTEHRQGINPGFLARHTLNLKELGPDHGALVAELDDLPCMDRVRLNERKGRLELAYDASHHNIDEMLAIVEKHGAVVNNNWWTRTKLDWQRQSDATIKDNAHREAFCCSKLPPGYDRK